MTHQQLFKMLKLFTVCSALLLIGAMFGCSDGSNGTSSGTVSGVVTDTGGNKLANITVTPAPAVQGLAAISTDGNGVYSMTIPNGNFTLTFAKAGYTSQALPVAVVSGQTTTLDVQMVQTAAAVVNVANATFANGTATLSATALVNDPALVGQPVTFTWTLPDGTTQTGASITVPKPSDATLKSTVANLATVRQSVYPPGHDPVADENDFDLPRFLPLDRFQVLSVPQQAFELAAVSTITVTATIVDKNTNLPRTFDDSATASVPTNTLPFVPNGGIRNVPVGQPVVLQGNLNLTTDGVTPQTTYAWTMTAKPANSNAVLNDPTTRLPHFIPDQSGIYTITETGAGTKTINIYAGQYVGILVPDASSVGGVLDVGCSNAGCHPGNFTAPFADGAQFFSTTPVNTVFSDWSKSGHSQIMVKGMQLGSHYSLGACAKCHSVGFAQFSSAVKAGGFKDIADASGFTNASFLANAPNFFKGFDQVLRVSEVQCETCHGPNTTAHATGDPDTISSRFSVAADVCGVCHGEPLRHGRFQEWRASGHGDFQTAMGEGVTGVAAATPFGTGPNTSCAGCHSGQGFPLWLGQVQGGNPSRSLNAANTAALAFLRTNNVQPQTCSTCHPVHNPGTQPGLVGNIVILRGDYQSGGAFDGTTPLLPAGFQANGVGKGALCITCHNSRNGGIGTTATLHEDGDINFGRLTAYAGPHEAAQGDVLMGRNSYYFSSFSTARGREDLNLPGFPKVPQLGQRSRHSFLADACVTCHLEKSPTDPALGYPPALDGAGTNHTFNVVTDKTRPAADQINALCSQCHSNFVGTDVQKTFDATYKQLLIAASKAVLRVKFGTAAAVPANTTLVFIPGRTPQVSVNGGVAVSLSTYLSAAPAAVGTANTGPIVGGFQRDLAKANWNIGLVAPKYDATQLDGLSYDDGTVILSAAGGTVGVAGDQSKGVHNPSFTLNLINVTINRLNAL